MKLHLSMLELFLASWPKRWSCSVKCKCSEMPSKWSLPSFTRLPFRLAAPLAPLSARCHTLWPWRNKWRGHMSNKSLKNPLVDPSATAAPKESQQNSSKQWRSRTLHPTSKGGCSSPSKILSTWNCGSVFCPLYSFVLRRFQTNRCNISAGLLKTFVLGLGIAIGCQAKVAIALSC